MLSLNEVKREVIEAIADMDPETTDNARESIMEADTLAEIGAILESHFGFDAKDTMEFILDSIVQAPPTANEPTKDDAYPITANLQKLVDELDPCDAEGNICQMIVDTVGAYEHGTADVEDFDFRDGPMEAYAAVAEDLIQTITAQI